MRPFPSLVAALAAVLICGISEAEAAVTIEREVPVDSAKPYTVAQDGSVWTTYSTSSTSGVIAASRRSERLDPGFFQHLVQRRLRPPTVDRLCEQPGLHRPDAVDLLLPSRRSVRHDQSRPRVERWRHHQPTGLQPGVPARRLRRHRHRRARSDGHGGGPRPQRCHRAVVLSADVLPPRDRRRDGQVCHVDSPPAPPGCGIGGGAFNYATDTAPDGDNGFFVTEYNGNTVTHVGISLSGYTISSFGSGPGSAAGQLSSPPRSGASRTRVVW